MAGASEPLLTTFSQQPAKQVCLMRDLLLSTDGKVREQGETEWGGQPCTNSVGHCLLMIHSCINLPDFPPFAKTNRQCRTLQQWELERHVLEPYLSKDADSTGHPNLSNSHNGYLVVRDRGCCSNRGHQLLLESSHGVLQGKTEILLKASQREPKCTL